jgi:hypothetical protein
MYDFASLTRNQMERTETLRRAAARSRDLAAARSADDAGFLARLRGTAARALRAFAARLDAEGSTSPGAA